MLHKVAYAPTIGQYNVALQELSSYKSELATWVGENDLEQWAESKFQKEQ